MQDLLKPLIDTSKEARHKVAVEMGDLAKQCREQGLEDEALQAERLVEVLLYGSDDELAAVVMTIGSEVN